MRTTLFTISALIAASATAGAQTTSTRLRIEPGSELSIAGTSNVHDFVCKTNKFSAYIDVDPSYSTKDLTRITRPIVSVNVVIAVKSLSCGNNKMDQNMYSTLKADKNHIIRYTLSGYDILNGSASAFAAKTTGTLTILGKEKLVAMTINAARLNDGKATAAGEETLLMSDFGIKPPSFMFGTMKVGDTIKVKFNLKVGPELIAQLSAATKQP